MNPRGVGPLALLGIVALGVAVQGGCRASKADATDALPPLASTPTKLEVPGHGDAVVHAPSGATHPLPIVVAVLGVGDTPEGQCATWREIVDGRAFTLCPRGKPNVIQAESANREEGDPTSSAAARREVSERSAAAASASHVSGFYPVDVETLDQEIDAAIGALRGRFGRHVATGAVVYAGFSRGAFLGASLVAKHPERYTRAVFVEGGQSPWSAESAAAFASGGGHRILFACGSTSCADESERAAKLLTAHGVEARVVHAQGQGHTYGNEVKERVHRSFDWLTAGDVRFQSPS